MKPVFIFLIFVASSVFSFSQQDPDKIFLQKIEPIYKLDSLSFDWAKKYPLYKNITADHKAFSDSLKNNPARSAFFRNIVDSLQQKKGELRYNLMSTEEAILAIADTKTQAGRELINFTMLLPSIMGNFLMNERIYDKTIDEGFIPPPPPPPAPVPVGSPPEPGKPGKEPAKEGVASPEPDKPSSESEVSDSEGDVAKVDLFSQDMKTAAEFLKVEKNLGKSGYELKKEDLRMFNPAQKEFIIYTIFALKGKIFAEKELTQFFGMKKWYAPQSAVVYTLMDLTDRKNLRTLIREKNVELKYWKLNN
ncbi:MAG: YARHG domain-containing protein [Ignavibacteriaceae bacterium]|nr:YARHG domain-containing protein [Ignavibacteriaceae bacterium]